MGLMDKLFGRDKAASDAVSSKTITVYAPLQGAVIPLDKVDDPIFSQGILGQGCGMEPEGDTVYAPFDGVVSQVVDSKHAIGVTSAGGVELLIHVGIDTVDMNGDGFSYLVKPEQTVKMGDPLLTFSAEKIKAAGHPMTTMIVVTNTDAFSAVDLTAQEHAASGEALLTLTR